MPHDFLLILHDLVVNMYLPLYTSQNLQPHELWDIYLLYCLQYGSKSFQTYYSRTFYLQGGFKTKNKKLFTYSFSWAPNGPEKGGCRTRLRDLFSKMKKIQGRNDEKSVSRQDTIPNFRDYETKKTAGAPNSLAPLFILNLQAALCWKFFSGKTLLILATIFSCFAFFSEFFITIVVRLKLNDQTEPNI